MKKFLRAVGVSLSVLLFAFTAARTEAQTYIIQDLGTLGGPTSFGNAVNASGQVAGVADTGSSSPGQTSRAFLSAANGGALTNLGSLGDNSVGQGVNDSGQ